MRNSVVFSSLILASLALAQGGGQHIQVGAAAPAIAGTLTDGKAFDSAAAAKAKPTFVVFWKERCPHNKPASAAFNALAKHYGDKVNFIGVVTASDEGAKAWTKQFQTTYPLLADAEKVSVKAYGLKASIATFQIGKDGKVEAVFPGYGRTQVDQLNNAMAKSSGMPSANLAEVQLPDALTWG